MNRGVNGGLIAASVFLLACCWLLLFHFHDSVRLRAFAIDLLRPISPRITLEILISNVILGEIGPGRFIWIESDSSVTLWSTANIYSTESICNCWLSLSTSPAFMGGLHTLPLMRCLRGLNQVESAPFFVTK